MNKSLVWVTMLSLIPLFSCIKRTETISIFADGSAEFKTMIEGDPDDIHNGDAMPTAESGWTVRDWTEVDDEGEQQLNRDARMKVAAGEPWSSSYAVRESRLERIALQFPTTLTIEQRDDGTYYHFKRIYRSRPYHFAHYHKEKLTESDEFKSLTEKNTEALTEEDYKKLAATLIQIDTLETDAFLDRARAQMGDALPQDVFLQARRAVLEEYDTDKLVEEVSQSLQSKEESLDQMEEELRKRQTDALKASLDAAKTDIHLTGQFVDAHERMRSEYEITNDLEDENWHVLLKMPGYIVAHNGDENFSRFEDVEYSSAEVLEEGVVSFTDAVIKMRTPEVFLKGDKLYIASTDEAVQEQSTEIPLYRSVAWEFDGKALQDRDVVLMATSFVPKKHDRGDE